MNFFPVAKDYFYWLYKGRKLPTLRYATWEAHNEQVKKISEQVKNGKHKILFQRKRQKHSAPRKKDFLQFSEVDISPLCHILEVNKKEGYLVAEPLATMENIVNAALAFGMRPLVVPEFKGITCGGAYQSIAGESTCHKYGFFYEKDNVLDVELLLSNGEIVPFSSDTYKECVSHAVPGSHGSLVLLTAIKIRIIPTNSYVEITYKHMSLQELLLADFSNYEFVDAIYKNDDRCIVVCGNDVPYNNQTLYKQTMTSTWFSAHVRNSLHNTTEVMPLKDYFFRWERGTFFSAEEKLRRNPNILERFILGSYANSKTFYRLGGKNTGGPMYIVQDIIFPKESISNFISEVKKKHKIVINSLWLLPITVKTKTIFGPPKGEYVSIGFYQKTTCTSYESFVLLDKEIEKLATKYGGYKALYAKTFYTEEEFWNIYDKEAYGKCCKILSAEKYQNIYERLTDEKDMAIIRGNGSAK